MIFSTLNRDLSDHPYSEVYIAVALAQSVESVFSPQLDSSGSTLSNVSIGVVRKHQYSLINARTLAGNDKNILRGFLLTQRNTTF